MPSFCPVGWKCSKATITISSLIEGLSPGLVTRSSNLLIQVYLSRFLSLNAFEFKPLTGLTYFMFAD